MTLTMVVSFALAIGIFMVLPYFLSDLLKKWISSYTVRIIIEGIIRIAIFVAYVGGISVMNDIKRLYRYHGAEHECINCADNKYNDHLCDERTFLIIRKRIIRFNTDITEERFV